MSRTGTLPIIELVGRTVAAVRINEKEDEAEMVMDDGSVLFISVFSADLSGVNMRYLPGFLDSKQKKEPK